jgi:Xaa-Pro aminopeptidase
MLQSFDATGTPEHGPARLAALRQQMAGAGLAGYIVPRADMYQGEYVAPRDARLEWLTGFSGSAGFCVALQHRAGVFIDGRYRTQVKSQVDLAHFTPVPWPETQAGAWIAAHAPQGGQIGYDPWLHCRDEIAKIEGPLAAHGITLTPCANLIDLIWHDQPGPPTAPAFVQDIALAGQSHNEKRASLAEGLRRAGHRAALITLPDSLCWLLNLRGGDVPRNPVLHGMALLHDTGLVDLFAHPSKFSPSVLGHLGPEVALHSPDQLPAHLARLSGPIALDPATAPLALAHILQQAQVELAWAPDPTRLPKACKNPAEIAGTRAAHLRDGAAMVEFLAWADQATRNPALTEIEVTRALEEFRRQGGQLHDISFDTICGAGPNGAIIHYRVTEASNRALGRDTLLLVDSGAQYPDGTTDVTRTLPLGQPRPDQIDSYTRVLQGLIALTLARWPLGLAGRDLEALARAPLWQTGRDYDHGTGHGVGAFLSVHEGPQRLSRQSEVPLQPGMILSNEPGYYREGDYGIRLENLVVVQPAPSLPGGDDHRAQLCFETLTLVPFDRRLIDAPALSRAERAWLNQYHAHVLSQLHPRLSPAAQSWCQAACAPL